MNRTKRFFSWLCVLVMITSFCVGTAVAAEEKVVITILGDNLGVTTPGIQDDEVALEIERRTGITMDIENVSSGIEMKILAMNASGDLPDIVNAGGLDVVKALVNADSIIDMSELIKTNGQNFLNNEKLAYAVEFNQKYRSFDQDKLFTLPMTLGIQASPVAPTVAPYIRWDLYREQGYPQINDLMDLLPILYQMQEDYPQTAEGKKAYGVSFWSDWGLWPILVFGFMDGYAEAGDFIGGNLGAIDISNDEFVPQITNDDSMFWKYVRFYNKAYQMGILDPDSFTQKYDQYSEKVTAGQSYLVIPGWLRNDWKGPNGEGYAPVDTTGDSNKCYAQYGMDLGMNQYAISKNCATPDRAMDLLNFFASDEGAALLLNGVEGLTWDIENGKPQFKIDVYEKLSDPNSIEALTYGVYKYSHLGAFSGGEISAKYGVPFDFRFTSDFISMSMTDVERDCAAFYNVDYPGEIFTRKEYSSYGNKVLSLLQPIEDRDYVQKATNVSNFVDENTYKLILAKSDDEFEQMRQEYLNSVMNMGILEVEQRFADEWNRCVLLLAELDK